MQPHRLLERGAVAERIAKGQAEKAHAGALQRAAIANTVAGRAAAAQRTGRGGRRELPSLTPRPAVVLAIAARSAASASAFCAFSACPPPDTTHSFSGPIVVGCKSAVGCGAKDQSHLSSDVALGLRGAGSDAVALGTALAARATTASR